MEEHLVALRFCLLQPSVCQLRFWGISYAQIIQALPGIKYNKHVSKCLTCTAAGFTWDIEQTTDRHPSLCPMDAEALILMVAHAEHNFTPSQFRDCSKRFNDSKMLVVALRPNSESHLDASIYLQSFMREKPNAPRVLGITRFATAQGSA
jgi:hypothetical protein